jgi:hypothetical protein
MTRDVLDYRQNAAGEHPINDSTPQNRDSLRICGKGPIANDVVGTDLPDVDTRCAVHVDSEIVELCRNEACRRKSCALPCSLIRGVEVAKNLRRRHFTPMWGAKPLDPSALLIDKDKDALSPNDRLEIRNEQADLLWVFDVASEENETARPLGRKEIAFGSR